MPEHIVFVMPPSDEDAEPFDIPEWSYGDAVATAERYCEHGWEACIIDYGMPFVLWCAERLDGPDIYAMARTRDEARIIAHTIGYDCDNFRRDD